MTPATIIAYRDKRHSSKKSRCACGRVALDYLPERRAGDIIHGASVCARYGKKAKP